MSHTARATDDTKYGYFEVRNNSDVRGAFFGWGNGAETVDLTLEAANLLNISG
ncbi:MAG: hypothetical protein KDJ45_06505 [Hyphomicrobiaceae bacterium]|nr:hypothetical protein [Hyphomicrobiaceae bacterium]MCC0009610.1 hypothetical protein [Hyphomicrobiaceae bacterium]